MATVYTVISRDKLDSGKEQVVISVAYDGTEAYSSGVLVDPFQLGLINSVDSLACQSAAGYAASCSVGSGNLGAPSSYGGVASPVVSTANWPKLRLYGQSGSTTGALTEVAATPALTVRLVATGF